MSTPVNSPEGKSFLSVMGIALCILLALTALVSIFRVEKGEPFVRVSLDEAAGSRVFPSAPVSPDLSGMETADATSSPAIDVPVTVVRSASGSDRDRLRIRRPMQNLPLAGAASAPVATPSAQAIPEGLPSASSVTPMPIIRRQPAPVRVVERPERSTPVAIASQPAPTRSIEKELVTGGAINDADAARQALRDIRPRS